MVDRNAHPFSKHLIEHVTTKGDSYAYGGEVIKRVTNESIAVICNSRLAHLYVNHYCDLVLLPDSNAILPRTIAVAFPRGSPHKALFDEAIKQLQLDGTIGRLKEKY